MEESKPITETETEVTLLSKGYTQPTPLMNQRLPIINYIRKNRADRLKREGQSAKGGMRKWTR